MYLIMYNSRCDDVEPLSCVLSLGRVAARPRPQSRASARPLVPMRLRVALRELRHSCALSAAEECALLKHCRTVESLATADFPRLAGTCALRADGLRLLAHELTAALAAELSRPGLAAHADTMRTDAILSTGLESLDALLGGPALVHRDQVRVSP